MINRSMFYNEATRVKHEYIGQISWDLCYKHVAYLSIVFNTTGININLKYESWLLLGESLIFVKDARLFDLNEYGLICCFPKKIHCI